MMDCINDALIACVKACGGSKQVAPHLWPEKAPDAAQRLLLDCLNEDRPQQLNPDQVVFILRTARDRGCHIGMQYLCAELSYAEPVPIEPKDAADELKRQYIEATRTIAKMAERIERLEHGGKPRAVA